ncbi:MAG: S53 family peptidase [Solirubrobacteraceae bacterium]
MEVGAVIRYLKGAGVLALVCGLGTLTSSAALASRTGAAGATHSGRVLSRSTVPLGIDAAAINGAKVLGNTPASTPETVSFIFKEQNLGTLEQAAQSDGFTAPYLTVSQFASEYGQPLANIQALQSYLAGYGISTTVYPNRIDVVATGTAGEFDSALSVTQLQYHTPALNSAVSGGTKIKAQTFHAPSSSPSLPSSIAENLVAILGLSNYAPSVSNALHVSRTLVKPAGTAASQSSSCLASSGVPDDCNLPQNFMAQYNLGPLATPNAGRGQTLGIITLASVDPGAPQYFWSKIAGVKRSGTLSYDNVDGGAGAASYTAGSGETDLDIEQSGSVAPGANIVVYTAPNTDSGFIDAFFTAASKDVAGSVSCSWGEAETVIQSAQALGQESSGYVAAFDEAMLEFDAQGQASFIASGDGGAYDAYGSFSGTAQPTNLSVDNPSDSPYTTAAGGTTLPWSAVLGPNSSGTGEVTVNVPEQRIWGWDYLWAPVAALDGISLQSSAQEQIAGSGGGFSVLEPQPSYQRDVNGTTSFSAVPYLTPTHYTSQYGISLPTEWTFNPTPTTIIGSGSGRATPDLAADADPYTGYILYAPSSAGQDGIASATQPGWGGTSFVAPQLNGVAAVIDAYLGQRTGFWNPAIYQFAKSSQSPFTSLDASGTSNDNLYYTGTAGATFVPGAGLGTPNLYNLAKDFAQAGR